jgi:hypothetical protein
VGTTTTAIVSPPVGPAGGAAATGVAGGAAAGGGAGVAAAAAAGAGGGAGEYTVNISAPFNVKHNIHVTVDATSATGFTGLPPQWDAMLSASGISKEQIAAHPREVLDVLQFHMEGPPPKLPKKTSLEKELDTASMITAGDPVPLFADLKKLGEGASGQVYLGTDRRTGEKVAIKVAPASDLANLKQEIALQKMSSHPCIVSYQETFLSRDQLWVSVPCGGGGGGGRVWLHAARRGRHCRSSQVRRTASLAP